MTNHVITSLAEMRERVGTTLGESRRVTITQEMVDVFARLTGDEQWIHVDPERAADGPYAGTVVHGYLTLSLGPMLAPDIFRVEDDVAFGVNYGANRLRFPAPLLTGSPIRLRIDLLDVVELEGATRLVMDYVFTAEGADRPCCVAEVMVQYFDEPAVPGR